MKRRYWLLAVAMGSGLFAMPLIASWRAGTLSSDDCPAGLALQRGVLGADKTPSWAGCAHTLPLAADFPSILLGISCGATIPVFAHFLWSLMTLDARLRHVGLLTTGAKEWMPRLVTRSWKRFWVPVVVVVVLAHIPFGLVFQETLSRGYLWGEVIAADGGRLAWWAQPAPGILGQTLASMSWLVVGTVGAGVATAHGALLLLASRSFHQQESKLMVRALPSHEDGACGWTPMVPLLRSMLIGSINFAIAILAVSYMLLGSNASALNVSIVLAVGAFGVTANYVMARRAFHFVRGTHARAIAAAKREADEQLSRLSTARFGRARSQFGRTMARRLELERAPSFPIQGLWQLLPAIAVALVANVGLIASLVLRLIAALPG